MNPRSQLVQWMMAQRSNAFALAFAAVLFALIPPCARPLTRLVTRQVTTCDNNKGSMPAHWSNNMWVPDRVGSEASCEKKGEEVEENEGEGGEKRKKILPIFSSEGYFNHLDSIQLLLELFRFTVVTSILSWNSWGLGIVRDLSVCLCVLFLSVSPSQGFRLLCRYYEVIVNNPKPNSNSIHKEFVFSTNPNLNLDLNHLYPTKLAGLWLITSLSCLFTKPPQTHGLHPIRSELPPTSAVYELQLSDGTLRDAISGDVVMASVTRRETVSQGDWEWV